MNTPSIIPQIATPYRLLLVEDDPMEALLVSEALQAQQFDITHTDSGIETIELLSDPENLFDIVLLDLNLPDISGEEVLTHIRKQASRLELPVVHYSANDYDQTVVKGLLHGANDYVVKGTEMGVLAARLKACVEARRHYLQEIAATENRVMKESIGAACHYVAQPLTAATTALEIIAFSDECKSSALGSQISNACNWIRNTGKQIHRLQSVHKYRTSEYLPGIDILDIPDAEGEEHTSLTQH